MPTVEQRQKKKPIKRSGACSTLFHLPNESGNRQRDKKYGVWSPDVVFPAFYLRMSMARPNEGEEEAAARRMKVKKQIAGKNSLGERRLVSSSRGNVASPRLVACFLVRESIFFCVSSLSSGLLSVELHPTRMILFINDSL